MEMPGLETIKERAGRMPRTLRQATKGLGIGGMNKSAA